MNVMLRTLVVTALFLATPFVASLPAFAHAMPAEAVPAINSTIAAPLPTEFTIKFTEPVEIVFTTVVITGSNGEVVSTGTLSLDPSDARIVVVPIVGDLPLGELTVSWKTVAVDSHKSDGTYHLTVTN